MSEAPSKPVRVTFFEDRAEVLRSARVAVAAGVTTVSIAGVTPLVHDPSLSVRAIGGSRVVASRVVRRIEHQPPPEAAAMASIEADLKTARRRRETAERALLLAQGDQQRSASLEESWIEALRRVPDGGSAQAGALRASLGAIDELLRASLDAAHSVAEELESARLDEARALARLQLARTAQPRAVTLVVAQIESPAAAEVELEIAYQAPCALWRPEHLARLDGDKLRITTFATAWQRTGEAWVDLPCRFSTARPARDASPPLLEDDVLQSRRKTAEERSTIVVEAREQVMAASGLDRGTRVLDEMPGVDDGGEPLWLEGVRPATVASDGQPVRIEVATVELPCSAERVAFPELTPMVHVRATATNTGKLPLLAGPVMLVRGGEAVGRGRMKFVGKGEPFEVGFGIDDGLRVRRDESDERDTVPILGTQKVTRTVRLYLSNLGGAPRKLSVAERVPVSEIEAVQVRVLEGGAADADGIVKLDVDLEPGATRELKIAWRLEASRNVRLPI